MYPRVREVSCVLELFDCLVQELCFFGYEGGLRVTGPSLKYLEPYGEEQIPGGGGGDLNLTKLRRPHEALTTD